MPPTRPDLHIVQTDVQWHRNAHRITAGFTTTFLRLSGSVIFLLCWCSKEMPHRCTTTAGLLSAYRSSNRSSLSFDSRGEHDCAYVRASLLTYYAINTPHHTHSPQLQRTKKAPYLRLQASPAPPAPCLLSPSCTTSQGCPTSLKPARAARSGAPEQRCLGSLSGPTSKPLQVPWDHHLRSLLMRAERPCRCRYWREQ